MRSFALGAAVLVTTACAARGPAPGGAFDAVPPASAAAITTARGALAWRGRGELPPGARVVHEGAAYTPPSARVALLAVAPSGALCALDERDPRVLVAVGVELVAGEAAESHAIRVVAGAATRTSARLRVARVPAEAGAVGSIVVEDAPGTTVRGGEVPLLLCE